MDEIIPLPDSVVYKRSGIDRVVLEQRKEVARYRKLWGDIGDSSRVICWDDLPAHAGEIEELTAYFQATYASEFRKAERLEHDLSGLERLRALTIPVSFIPGLDPKMLPPSLVKLAVSAAGRTSFPKGVAFPGIGALDTWTSYGDREVKFQPGAFPDLQELECRLDAKRTLLDVIATYPHLARLGMGPIKDPSVLARLAGMAVDFLALEGGSLSTLDGIQDISGLRYLELRRLDRLVDIKALEYCKDLEVLQIHWCANLGDHETMLRIPKLRSLYLHRCNGLDPVACAADVAARPGLMSRVWHCLGTRRK